MTRQPTGTEHDTTPMHMMTGTTNRVTGSMIRPWSVRRAALSLVASSLVAHGSALAAETVRLTADLAAARIVEISHLSAAATARVDAAAASVESADALTLPTVAVSANLARRSSIPEFFLPAATPSHEPPLLAPNITNVYGATLKAQQTLYSGGAISATRQAVRADRDTTEAARLQTLADLRLAGRLAYWELVRTRATLDATRANEERAKRLLADTTALLDAGMTVKAEVLGAEERVASARLQVLRADNAAANAVAQMRSLLGLAADAEIEAGDSLAGPLPAVPPAQADLQSQAVQKRPELGALAAQHAALRAREGVARSPALPNVAAIAQYDYLRPNQRYFPTRDEWKDSWSVGLFASWTVYDGGKSRSEVAASRGAARAVEQDRDELVRRVRLEVETARRDLENALATVAAADAAQLTAKARDHGIRDRQQAGLAAIAEVLDAQAALANTEQEQVASRAAAWIAAARLARAIGQ